MRFYATEIILGLEHMHNRFVVYRDLKVMLGGCLDPPSPSANFHGLPLLKPFLGRIISLSAWFLYWVFKVLLICAIIQFNQPGRGFLGVTVNPVKCYWAPWWEWFRGCTVFLGALCDGGQQQERGWGFSLTLGKSRTGPREESLDQVAAQGDESLPRDWE